MAIWVPAERRACAILAAFGTAVFLAVLKTLVACYRVEIKSALARIDGLHSQVADVGFARIEYLCMGDGYPVLVVHGAMGGVDQGLWIARRVVMGPDMPSLQVIAVSRFGYLRSPVPPGANLNLQADAYGRLLDELQIPQVAVLALSAGWTSAIRFAARYPHRVSAVVLLCPDAPPGMSLPPRFVVDHLLRSDFFCWVGITFFGKALRRVAGLVPRGFALAPEQEAAIAQLLKDTQPLSQRIEGFIFETYTTADEFNASVTPACPYPLAEMRTPVLVVNALDDRIAAPVDVRHLVERLRNVRHVVVPDGGHFFLGDSDELKAEIVQFLQDNLLALRGES